MLGQRMLVAVVLALLCAAAPSELRAQAEDEAEQDAKESARLHFERGNRLIADEAYDAALAEFQRSRALFPTRGNTQNTAVALAKLGRYVEALEMYRTLVRDFQLEPAERESVEREVEFLSGLVGTITVRAEPGATVIVDGTERGTTPLGPLPVSAGSRSVRVVKPGRIPFERRIDVVGGQSVEIEAPLAELVQRVERVERVPSEPPERAPPRAESSGNPLLAAQIGLALGPGLGGPLADRCAAGCESELALGVSATARAGWQFPSGIDLGGELGFLRLGSGYTGREDFIEVVGPGEQRGVADDDLVLQGFTVGAFAGYSRGERWVWRLGLGAGAVFASVRDTRSGAYGVTPDTGAPYTANVEIEQTQRGSLGYALLEPFVGYRVLAGIEVGIALGAAALFGLRPPRFDREEAVLVENAAGDAELAYLRGDELTGTPMFLLLPRLGVSGRL